MLPRIHYRDGRGSNYTKVVVHPNELISKLNSLSNNNLPNVPNFSCISIMGMKKSTLKKSAELVNKLLNKNHDDIKIKSLLEKSNSNHFKNSTNNKSAMEHVQNLKDN